MYPGGILVEKNSLWNDSLFKELRSLSMYINLTLQQNYRTQYTFLNTFSWEHLWVAASELSFLTKVYTECNVNLKQKTFSLYFPFTKYFITYFRLILNQIW